MLRKPSLLKYAAGMITMAICPLFASESNADVKADTNAMSTVPTSPYYLSDAQPGWYYDAFIGLGSEPTYAGSDNSESEIEGNARAFYVTESGHRYYFSLGEVGGYWTLGDNTQLVAFLEFEEGRESDDDAIFDHFEEVESTLEGQFLLVHRWDQLYASLVLQPDLLGRGKGVVWFAAIARDWFYDNWRVTLSADISGANRTYMETEFGVSAQAAAGSGLAIYQPSAGLKSLSTQLAAEYQFSPSMSLLGTVEWESYLNDAADSPLIQDIGSKNTLAYSLLLRYQF